MAKPRSKKLNRAVDDFCEAMKTRLAKKERDGFRGWDNELSVTTKELARRASDKCYDVENGIDVNKNSIDIANLMMMVYFRKNNPNK